jgi:hypothetical protein
LSRDDTVLAIIDAAFGAVTRPAHFHGDLADPEASEHDALLRSRDRETLSLADVGNAGWDPMFDAVPHGIAYFFPKLARLALATPSSPWNWYAAQLLFHLSYKSHENAFHAYCNPQQRAAVAAFLAHVIDTRADLLRERESADEFTECLALWQGSSR